MIGIASMPCKITPIIDHEIEGAIAWTGKELAPSDGCLHISSACIEELDNLAQELRANPSSLFALRLADFSLPETARLMLKGRRILEDGPGFVLLDRLPLDRWSREEANAVYWLLCSMVARPVAQKWDGTMIYDVRDTGQKPGNGVRPDITNAAQNFHTDNSYNLCPPWYVALLCRQTAKEGGVSGLVSFYTAHNKMRRRHPELLERLYEDFAFDRQREHAPDDVKILRHPMFEVKGGRLIARLSRFQVMNGQKLACEELDTRGEAAMEAFEAILHEQGMVKEFFFEPGQIQIVDNRRCGHRRTGFMDWPEPERRRHLIRLWLRGEGRPFYNG
jgi:alpha-ketoglutarate-dependent taurine dioxygenase